MMVFALALIFGVGLCLNLLFTPLARALAGRAGLVDRPDGRRKLHGRTIPLAGGPAVLVSVVATILLAITQPEFFPIPEGYPTFDLIGLLVAAVVICCVGVIDDARGLRGRYKLLGQLLAVGIVIAFGSRVDRVELFGQNLSLGLFSIPLTVFLLLGAINSLNLLDGMDGLLGTVGMIICLAFGAMAVLSGQMLAAWIAFAMAGALLAFLRYNFPPATIFMGDSGSMLVGLVVGVLAIHGSMKAPTTIALLAPTCVLIIPIFDTGAAIVRRKLAGRSLFSTDRAHLHHCLLRSGFTRRGALLVVSGLCFLAMFGGIASISYRSEAIAAITAAVVVAILVATQLFGYSEVRLVYQRLMYMSRFVFPDRSGRGETDMVLHIQGTIDWRLLWRELVEKTQEVSIHHIRLDIDDPSICESFHARMTRRSGPVSEASRALKIIFPLTVHGRVIGRVEVSGDRNDTPLEEMVALLTELLREAEETALFLLEQGSLPKAPSSIEPRHRRAEEFAAEPAATVG
jgi:UDP-GlcNAc:undecaprenyl-phosphate GlcNAc-1-phosphate transferase